MATPRQLYTEIDRQLDQLIADITAETDGILEEMEEQVLNKVAKFYREYSDADGMLKSQNMRVYDREDKLNKELAAIIIAGWATSRKKIYAGLTATYRTGFNDTQVGIEGLTGKAMRGTAKADRIRELIQDRLSGVPLSDRIHRNRQETIFQIRQVLGQGISRPDGINYRDMAISLSERLKITKGQAERIVETETHRIIEAAKFDAVEHAERQGVKHKKYWLSMRDEKVRNNHRRLDQIYSTETAIPIYEPFVLPGVGEAMRPGEFGIANEDIRCRCAAVYVPQ